MAVDAFYIDIEDSSGNRQGAGPILSAEGWTYTARMDRAGSFAFTMPASDDMADEVQKKRVARAYALLNDTWTEVGAGIIDNITKAPGPDGRVMLVVSGDDELRELTYRSVGFLELESAGSAITHSAAVTAIDAYKPSGWTLTADALPGHDSIYGAYAGETVLQALVALGEKSQSHFYRSGAKALTFASTFSDSGIRAIRADGDLSAETCAIVDLQEQIDTHDLITRIHPFGAGQGRARLTLAPTSRSAGTGYTLNKSLNVIVNDTVEATYGIIDRWVEFKDIAPISNTDGDLQAAADMLYDVALEELTRRSTELEQATYTLRLAQCEALLRPLQTIRVVYYDPDSDMDVDADLNILEATLQVDADGLRTTGLVVSNADRWPEGDSDVVAAEMAQGMVFQAHPQMNANSYTTAYRVNIDDTETATIRFRLGAEVVQVQSVLLDFQLLPFESTVTTVAGATSGSGVINTDPSAEADTGTGGNNDTGAGGGTNTGSTAPNTGSTAPNTGSTAPNTGITAPDTGSTAPITGSTTGTTGYNPNADTGYGGGSDTGGTSLTTNSDGGGDTSAPQGGDVVSSGQHQHSFLVTGGSTITYNIGFSAAGPAGGLRSEYGSDAYIVTNQKGDHTHTISDHTHTVADHTHTIATHTHTTAPHTHSVIGHTHATVGHTHTTASHTHTTAGHTHTTAGHTHTTTAHTHTTAGHTHTTASHTHSLNNHTHDLSEALAAVYGIYREEAANTYELSHLQYRVNGGSWTELSTATSLGGDWYQIDVTSSVADSTTLRPTAASNTIDIAANEVGIELDRTVTVDGLLSVRNIIQAIAYT